MPTSHPRGPAERGRRHADNLEGFSGDRHGGADDPRIDANRRRHSVSLSITTRPLIVARLNRASELGAHAERGEAYDPLTDSPMTISVTDGRARRRTNVADAATWENDCLGGLHIAEVRPRHRAGQQPSATG